jgi:hypothetical protein
MKKAKGPERDVSSSDDLRPEYRFDYRKSRPNRFADRLESEKTIVTLDSDVAEVFKTSESVNSVLRALIAVMPVAPNRTKARRAGQS